MEVDAMKKAVILLLVIGMFGWAVYDFVIKSDDLSSIGETTDTSDATHTEEVEVSSEKDAIVGLDKGNIAPDFELNTLEGETVRLSDFRGERVMINFWA